MLKLTAFVHLDGMVRFSYVSINLGLCQVLLILVISESRIFVMNNSLIVMQRIAEPVHERLVF